MPRFDPTFVFAKSRHQAVAFVENSYGLPQELLETAAMSAFGEGCRISALSFDQTEVIQVPDYREAVAQQKALHEEDRQRTLRIPYEVYAPGSALQVPIRYTVERR